MIGNAAVILTLRSTGSADFDSFVVPLLSWWLRCLVEFVMYYRMIGREPLELCHFCRSSSFIIVEKK